MKFFNNNSPEISYYGRWQNGYSGFGATYIKTRFTGTKIGLLLKSTKIWWRVYIDNEKGSKFTSNGEILLADNLENKEHEFLLVRLTEGQAGIAYFGGFFLEKNSKLIFSPKKQYTFEFIGDSITAGAINDGKLNGSNYNEIGDNEYSYGPILARMIGAEYSVIAKSGQGVAVNYTERPPFTMPHAADLYNWAFFYKDFGENNIIWEAKKLPIDATFVAYGTNDFITPNEKPSEKEFKENYKRIINNIRKMNGNIPIICILIPSSENVPFASKYISETINEIKSIGDKNIYYIEINETENLLNERDYIDGKIHPTKEGSKKVAEFLISKIKKILKL